MTPVVARSTNVRLNPLERLGELGIATESTGRRRDRLYTYRKQLAILDRGTT